MGEYFGCTVISRTPRSQEVTVSHAAHATDKVARASGLLSAVGDHTRESEEEQQANCKLLQI